MKIKLLENVHEEYCPKGTIGELTIEHGVFPKIKILNPSKDNPFKDEIYIGNKKYEVIDEQENM